jgi:hypothetical protein
MDPTEVSVDEAVPGLGVIVGTLGQPEMPCGVLIPGMGLQEGVLVVGAGLTIAPVAVDYVLASVNQSARLCDRLLVE